MTYNIQRLKVMTLLVVKLGYSRRNHHNRLACRHSCCRLAIDIYGECQSVIFAVKVALCDPDDGHHSGRRTHRHVSIDCCSAVGRYEGRHNHMRITIVAAFVS